MTAEENNPVVATLVAATFNKLRRIALAVNVTELMKKLPILKINKSNCYIFNEQQSALPITKNIIKK
ncbi:hypothetical protein GCM10011607_09960 [Shewanella inventionis]|uniref:Uncharacterized protein n=1 Tax=Shewanella inventionis TaxID=1738770 RepID=A0ABQ1IUJ7_9GAMM|nr:hypothetical protein GCM10011607_09960 [Shewanella inventionis]